MNQYAAQIEAKINAVVWALVKVVLKLAGVALVGYLSIVAVVSVSVDAQNNTPVAEVVSEFTVSGECEAQLMRWMATPQTKTIVNVQVMISGVCQEQIRALDDAKRRELFMRTNAGG